MRIDRTGRGAAPGAARTRRPDGPFNPPEDRLAGPAASDAAAVASMLPVDMLQNEAAEPPPPAANPACAAHGRALLGALAGLQLATLGGAGGHARRTLADLARALPHAADPGLDAVLQAIAQRAAIELARGE